MHKGWWAVVVYVAAQIIVGAVLFDRTHAGGSDGDNPPGDEPPPAEDAGLPPPTGERLYLPASLLPDTVLDEADPKACVRVCAVPGEDEDSLAGRCSPALPVIGSVEDNAGETWLAVEVPAAGAAEYRPFFAARERRLLAVDAGQCATPAPVETPEEPPAPADARGTEG